MMNWILLVMGLVVSVTVAVLAGGLLVPARYTVTRRARLRADVAHVHAVLQGAATWPVWLSLARTGMVESMVEPAEHTSGGEGVLVAVLDDAGQGVAGIRFTLTAAPDAAHATDVLVTEAGHEANPVKRLRRQYLSSGPVMAEALLRALAEQVGDPTAAIRGD